MVPKTVPRTVPRYRIRIVGDGGQNGRNIETFVPITSVWRGQVIEGCTDTARVTMPTESCVSKEGGEQSRETRLGSFEVMDRKKKLPKQPKDVSRGQVIEGWATC